MTQQDTWVTSFHEEEFQLAKPSGIILCMRPANERRRYTVTSCLIGWAHTQNDPWPWQCWGMIGNINTCLTHWGRETHICISKLTIIGSDNGLSPDRCQAIIWTSAGILLIGHLGTNFSEILIEIITFSFKKMHLKVSSAKWRPCCLGLNVLHVSLKQFNTRVKHCHGGTKIMQAPLVKTMAPGNTQPSADIILNFTNSISSDSVICSCLPSGWVSITFTDHNENQKCLNIYFPKEFIYFHIGAW